MTGSRRSSRRRSPALVSEPLWLLVGEVIDFNRFTVERTGEPFLIRDQALLESACARPQNLAAYGEEDLLTLAVALLAGIARNHPFMQGNKRTAFKACQAFLVINDLEIAPALDSLGLADQIVALIEGRKSEADLVNELRPHIIEAMWS